MVGTTVSGGRCAGSGGGDLRWGTGPSGPVGAGGGHGQRGQPGWQPVPTGGREAQGPAVLSEAHSCRGGDSQAGGPFLAIAGVRQRLQGSVRGWQVPGGLGGAVPVAMPPPGGVAKLRSEPAWAAELGAKPATIACLSQRGEGIPRGGGGEGGDTHNTHRRHGDTPPGTAGGGVPAVRSSAGGSACHPEVAPGGTRGPRGGAGGGWVFAGGLGAPVRLR